MVVQSGMAQQLCTAVDTVAFCFDSLPTSSRIREFSTALHYWFNDVIFGVELI